MGNPPRPIGPPPSVTVSSIVLVELTTADNIDWSSSLLIPSSPARLNKWNRRRHLSEKDPFVKIAKPHKNSSKSTALF